MSYAKFLSVIYKLIVE